MKEAQRLRFCAVVLLFISVAGSFRAAWAEKNPKNTDQQPEMKKFFNLPYDSMKGVDPKLLSLDVYAPPTGANNPVLVMVHGGGWRFGDKSNPGSADLKASFFVDKGYVFVSVNYRLSPKVTHPVHVRDLAKALTWLHKNVSEYGGDPDSIFIMGHSAGAHLVSLVATDERHLEAKGEKLTLIKGVISLDSADYDIPKLMNGIYGSSRQKDLYRSAFGDEESAWRDASPFYHVQPDKGIAPFLVFHTGSRLDAAANSRSFVEALTKAGGQAKRIHARDKSHLSLNRDIGKPDDQPTKEIIDFLDGLTTDPQASR